MANWTWRRRVARRRLKATRHPEPWVLRHALVVLVVGAAGAIAVFVLTYRATGGSDKDRFDVAIKAATATAALAAGLLTWGRLELSRHEHRLDVDRDLTERYGRAVDQLGSDDELVRVGGVFALERFALDAAHANSSSDVDWRMALGMLAALARKDSAPVRDALEAAERGESQAEGKERKVPAPTSALEAMRALARFAYRSGRRLSFEDGPDLAGVVVPHAHLGGADLPGANLTRAILEHADLTRADLTRANLAGATVLLANLTRASLTEAGLTRGNLAGAILEHADLTRADLTRANLTGADLGEALLRGANLTEANLTSAFFLVANLTGATLISANLANAHLGHTDLTGANLTEANLTRVDLSHSNLTHANLAGATLTSAFLWEADLTGAILTGADLTHSDLLAVRYDRAHCVA